MTSIEHDKEVGGNLAEISAKVNASEVRSFMNFLQPKQLLLIGEDLFICHTKHKQIINPSKYFLRNVNKLKI
jgi:hypothetical protein